VLTLCDQGKSQARPPGKFRRKTNQAASVCKFASNVNGYYVIIEGAEDTRKKEPIGMQGLDRITFDPNIMGGRATIRGMRNTVARILNLVAGGLTNQQIIEQYPYVDEQDIRQSLLYASWLAEEQVFPLGKIPA
jgi:uncharacterized protein (DUF433 family)